jgi:hypothetical protein
MARTTIYRIRGEHANHYVTDAVVQLKVGPSSLTGVIQCITLIVKTCVVAYN